jgi:ABC-type uncharacterized transport system substrate-binding protein
VLESGDVPIAINGKVDVAFIPIDNTIVKSVEKPMAVSIETVSSTVNDTNSTCVNGEKNKHNGLQQSSRR